MILSEFLLLPLPQLSFTAILPSLWAHDHQGCLWLLQVCPMLKWVQSHPRDPPICQSQCPGSAQSRHPHGTHAPWTGPLSLRKQQQGTLPGQGTGEQLLQSPSRNVLLKSQSPF